MDALLRGQRDRQLVELHPAHFLGDQAGGAAGDHVVVPLRRQIRVKFAVKLHQRGDHRLSQKVEIAHDVLERQRRVAAHHRRPGRRTHRLTRTPLHVTARRRTDESLGVGELHEQLDNLQKFRNMRVDRDCAHRRHLRVLAGALAIPDFVGGRAGEVLITAHQVGINLQVRTTHHRGVVEQHPCCCGNRHLAVPHHVRQAVAHRRGVILIEQEGMHGADIDPHLAPRVNVSLYNITVNHPNFSFDIVGHLVVRHIHAGQGQ